MSQPEISRRCLSCGASVRAGARFCPQCGASVKDGAHATPDGNQAADAAASVREAAPEAPSRREVVSAFETWREDARPSSPAGVGGPERRETETDSAARPSVEEEPPTRSEAARQETAGGGAAAIPYAPAARREDVDEGVADSNPAAAEQGPGVEAARRRRAGAVVKENIMPRVGRMRDEALVALEETPDDAGLRFVAAAVVLFLLFLLFLFLSTSLK